MAQFIVRDLEGRIIYWSAAAQHLYGWSREEAVGQISHDLLSTEFPKPLVEIESELRDVGVWDGELVHRTKEGRVVHIASHFQLHPGDDTASFLLLGDGGDGDRMGAVARRDDGRELRLDRPGVGHLPGHGPAR